MIIRPKNSKEFNRIEIYKFLKSTMDGMVEIGEDDAIYNIECGYASNRYDDTVKAPVMGVTMNSYKDLKGGSNIFVDYIFNDNDKLSGGPVISSFSDDLNIIIDFLVDKILAIQELYKVMKIELVVQITVNSRNTRVYTSDGMEYMVHDGTLKNIAEGKKELFDQVKMLMEKGSVEVTLNVKLKEPARMAYIVVKVRDDSILDIIKSRRVTKSFECVTSLNPMDNHGFVTSNMNSLRVYFDESIDMIYGKFKELIDSPSIKIKYETLTPINQNMEGE